VTLREYGRYWVDPERRRTDLLAGIALYHEARRQGLHPMPMKNGVLLCKPSAFDPILSIEMSDEVAWYRLECANRARRRQQLCFTVASVIVATGALVRYAHHKSV